MKRPWVYLLLPLILATSLLAACSAGGAASGRPNCSHAGEVCVNLSTVSFSSQNEYPSPAFRPRSSAYTNGAKMDPPTKIRNSKSSITKNGDSV